MKRLWRTSLTILGLITLFAWPKTVELRTQITSQSGNSGINLAKTAQAPKPGQKEDPLAVESKQAILAAGISGAYFARHFQLVKVVNKPGDRRIVWRFRINEYEATVDDSIGYYTEGGRQVNIHSVTNLLKPAHEIIRTISRARARRLMRACIGEFEDDAVSYQGSPGGATLVFTAQAKVSRSRESREKENDAAPPTVLGALNLETGKCTKGRLMIAP